MEKADRQTTGEELNRLLSDEELGRLQLTTLQYYFHESNPVNGLIRDKTDPRAPSSIAAIGLGLATVPVLVERGVISREFAPEFVLKRLRFFRDSPQGPQPDATGYQGFYYHFLDIKTGRRVSECELSTIDSAFLFAGMLTCAAYFDGDTEQESEVRRLADELYCRANWLWATNGGAAICHGWRPETGFIPHYWTGYDEALLVYLLGLGSPTFPCRRRATPLTALPIAGSKFTAASCSTPGRSSRTNSRISGLTSATSVTRLCGSTTATTSRTAARLRMFTRSTRGTTRSNSRATANSAGGSRRPTDPGGRSGWSMASSDSSTITALAGRHMALTTALWRRGLYWPRCRSPRRS